MKQLFFVYGTLKNGYWNNTLVKSGEFLGEFITEPQYTLFDGGYPVVERGGEDAIHGELFLLTDQERIRSVFLLEGCESQIQGDKNNWYDFDKISTPHGEAIIFVMDKDQSGRFNILKNGIWK